MDSFIDNLAKIKAIQKFITKNNINLSNLEYSNLEVDTKESQDLEIYSNILFLLDIEILFSICSNSIWYKSDFFRYILRSKISSQFPIPQTLIHLRIEKIFEIFDEYGFGFISDKKELDKLFVNYITSKTLSGEKNEIKMLSQSLGTEILHKIRKIASDLDESDLESYSFYSNYDNLIYESLVQISTNLLEDSNYLQKTELFYYIVETESSLLDFGQMDATFETLITIGTQKSLKFKEINKILLALNIPNPDEFIEKLIQLDLVFVSSISSQKSSYAYSLTSIAVNFTKEICTAQLVKFYDEDLSKLLQYNPVYLNEAKKILPKEKQQLLNNSLDLVEDRLRNILIS